MKTCTYRSRDAHHHTPTDDNSTLTANTYTTATLGGTERQQCNNDHSANEATQNTPEQSPAFTTTELQKAINQLRNGRCRDTAGVIAEMITAGGDHLQQQLLRSQRETTLHNRMPHHHRSGEKTMITVLYKSGDSELPQNYRPIAIIPLLYKLFARLTTLQQIRTNT